MTGGGKEFQKELLQIGVPLGLFSAFVLHLPIAAVYFLLSMEECIRVVISLAIFRKKKWMQKL